MRDSPGDGIVNGIEKGQDREILAIAIDVDGTITDSSSRLCIAAIEALREAEARGTPVMLATGNVLPITFGLARFLGVSGPVVAENGGLVYYDGEVHTLASPEGALKAYEHLKKNMDVKRLFTDQWRLTEVGLVEDRDVEEVKEMLNGWDIEVSRTGFAIHLHDLNVTKFTGVKKGAALLGIDTENVLAIGDSHNDLCVLEGCGTSATMANGDGIVKGIVDYIAEGAHGEGVAQILEHFGLR